jgi:hypothetical protein
MSIFNGKAIDGLYAKVRPRRHCSPRHRMPTRTLSERLNTSRWSPFHCRS